MAKKIESDSLVATMP